MDVIVDTIVFQSTHPVWDATPDATTPAAVEIFQSTHPVWDATPSLHEVLHYPEISIHASRMGCDLRKYGETAITPQFQSTHPVWDATITSTCTKLTMLISIHASRMGCDTTALIGFMTAAQFQSTHPVWDATQDAREAVIRQADFNPRIPYGMRPIQSSVFVVERVISIHASRMGCDGLREVQSITHDISIHASRMGCDVEWS